MGVHKEMRDVLSKRTVDRDPDREDKFSDDRKDLIRLLGDNRENDVLTGILEELHQNNSKWNIVGLMGLIFENSISVLHYPAERYGEFIVTLQDGTDYLKLKIKYDVSEGRKTITYFDYI